MKMLPVLALSLLLAGCGEHDHDGGHGHEHGDAAGHAEHDAAPTPAPAKVAAAAAVPSAPLDLTLGHHGAQLAVRDGGLDLTLADEAPAGEARVVLTGVGQEPQKLVMTAGESGWTTDAKTTGAAGYVAVVTWTHDGNTESARVQWGDVPVAKAPEKVEHDDHGDHPHGAGGHNH